MRIRVSLPLLTILLLATLVAAAAVPAEAAPPEQSTVTIIVLGFVDVVGGNDPACPGCNGEFDPGDQQEAERNPLPSFTVTVRNAAGTQVARESTRPLAGLQRVSISVPEDSEFEVEIEDPSGWQLCPNESKVRTLTAADFQLGNALEEYHFWKGCASMPTATTRPPATQEPTVVPGQPTRTPRPTDVPGTVPTSVPGTGDEDEDTAVSPPAPSGEIGSIRGLAFIDENEDGMLGPEEPGISSIGVYLHGGSTKLSQATNGAGQFSFDGLPVGKYDVYIDPGADWRVTTTDRYTDVEVVDGETVMGIDFGLVRINGTTDAELIVPPPGGGIRLPDTGIADMSPSKLVTVMALLLAGLALFGFSSERLNRR